MARVRRNLKDELNRMNPTAAHVKLGDVVDELIEKHNALLAKLDADEAVTDSDYVATLRVPSLSER